MFCAVVRILPFLFCIQFVHARCTGYRSPMTSTAGSGMIQSPKYPNSYQDYENCRWVLKFPFDHKHYIAFFDVEDVQLSHERFGETQKKCTGHVSFYGAETDCRSESSFCNVYYVSSLCQQVVQEKYSRCNQFKRRTLIPTEVKFKSDSYYSDRTPQRGFKLKFEFINCMSATATTKPATTTAPTTTSTTTSPKSTVKPTTPTPTPSSTTAEPTTPPKTTTPSPTTTITTGTMVESSTSQLTTVQKTTTRVTSEMTSPIEQQRTTSILAEYATWPIFSSEARPSNDSVQYISAPASKTDKTPPGKLIHVNPVSSTTPSEGDNKGVTKVALTTSISLCIDGGSDCIQKQSENSSSITWIAAPIVVGSLVLIFVAYIFLVRRYRKKKDEDISYLVGIDNPRYNELRKRDLVGVAF